MAFVPRSQTQVVAEMEADLRARTAITDFNAGSNALGFIETVGTQIAETDFQMSEALDDVSIQTASGTGLDRRAADYGETAVRLPPAPAGGHVVVQDDGLVRSELLSGTVVGAVALPLNPGVRSGSDYFPTAGFPVNVRLDEGLVNEETVIVSANNTTTDVLTCAATLYAHAAGARVAYVTGAADRTLSTGIVVRRPSTGLLPVADYATTRPGVLVNGNYQSNRIPITAVVAGSNGNCGPVQVSQFASTPPFDGALVTNPAAVGGGRELETDADFRDRILAARQSMSRATKLALKQAVLGVTDATTGKTVASASVVEDFFAGEVQVYIDDGSGSSPATARLATSTVFALTAPGAATLSAPTALGFPAEGWIIVSPEDAAQTELLQYTAVTYGSPASFTLVGVTAKQHDLGDQIALVDMLSESAEAGQRRFRSQQAPWLPSSARLWVDSGGGPVLMALGVDWLGNRGTGEVEMEDGVAAAARVALSYSYYSELLQRAQEVLNGDPLDAVDLPGWSAAGVVTVVAHPIIVPVRVRMSISALPNSGITESQLQPLVKSAVESYIESLGVGADVVLAEIVAIAMGVPGVYDCTVQAPPATFVIGENELATAFNASGSMVSVN